MIWVALGFFLVPLVILIAAVVFTIRSVLRDARQP